MSTAFQPTIDVVVPCYNYARFLRRCVGSVLSQPDVRARVLIIDDASSDDSADVGRALAAEDARVTFRRHEQNKGHIATYNEGLLDWTRAEYVALLSADDCLVPGSLARATSIMNDDPLVGMVYGRPYYFETEPPPVRIPKGPVSFIRWNGAEWLTDRFKAGVNVISSPEVVVRGDIQRSVGGYDPRLPHSGDLEMWLRVAAVSDIAYVRKVPQAYYRVHSVSMSRTRYAGKVKDLQERHKAFTLFLDRGALDAATTARLNEMSSRVLAREALWAACRAYDRDQVTESNAAGYVAFARSIYADCDGLPESAALRRRQHVGPSFCRKTQLFLFPAAVRRARNWLWWQRWKVRGV